MKKSVFCLKAELRVGRFLIPYRLYKNDGPQIICVNGIQQSMAMWHMLITRFSHDYQMVLFDFPNQGKAKILSGPSKASLDEQVEILLAVMDKTGINAEARLCTASWGGVVAAALASRYPDRVKRLIMASLGTKPNKKMVETIKKGANLDPKDRDVMAETLIASFGQALPSHLKLGIVNQFKNMDVKSIQAFCEHGLSVIASKQLSEVVKLSSIKAKTILLHGENDTIIDLDDVKFLAAQIPDCKLKIIKGVGHFLHMEQETVLDVYADILR